MVDEVFRLRPPPLVDSSAPASSPTSWTVWAPFELVVDVFEFVRELNLNKMAKYFVLNMLYWWRISKVNFWSRILTGCAVLLSMSMLDCWPFSACSLYRPCRVQIRIWAECVCVWLRKKTDFCWMIFFLTWIKCFYYWLLLSYKNICIRIHFTWMFCFLLVYSNNSLAYFFFCCESKS